MTETVAVEPRHPVGQGAGEPEPHVGVDSRELRQWHQSTVEQAHRERERSVGWHADVDDVSRPHELRRRGPTGDEPVEMTSTFHARRPFVVALEGSHRHAVRIDELPHPSLTALTEQRADDESPIADRDGCASGDSGHRGAIVIDRSGSMTSDARLDAANALTRATLAILARRHPDATVTVIGAGVDAVLLASTATVDGTGWVDIEAEPGAGSDLAAGVRLAASIGVDRIVILTDPPGFELAAPALRNTSSPSVTVFAVRHRRQKIVGDDVVAALIGAGPGGRDERPGGP